MITTIQRHHYWLGLKKEIVEYIARCIKCQLFKTKYKYPIGLLQLFPVYKWKWEVIPMDIIMRFPKMIKKYDGIMVAIGKLNNVSHFIPIK